MYLAVLSMILYVFTKISVSEIPPIANYIVVARPPQSFLSLCVHT